MSKYIGAFLIGGILFVLGIPWWAPLVTGGAFFAGVWLLALVVLAIIYLISYIEKFKENYKK